jgi:hypothetical protein
MQLFKSLHDNNRLLKIYQCQKCNRVFRHETDREEHGRGDSSHQGYREYELETFLTRFLAA